MKVVVADAIALEPAFAQASFGEVQTPRPAPGSRETAQHVLMSLEGIKVEHGVMAGDTLRSAEDLLEGDHWSFKPTTNKIPANVVDETCCISVVLATGVEIGAHSFVIGTAIRLTLMSNLGTLLECRFVTNRDRYGNGYLLLPASFDVKQSYDVIERRG